MKIAIVFGGAGFIGKHLCASLLEDGHKVICVDNFSSSDENSIPETVFYNKNFVLSKYDVTKPSVLGETTKLLYRLLGKNGIHTLEYIHIYNLACPASPVQYKKDEERTLFASIDGMRHALNLAENLSILFPAEKDYVVRVLFTSTSEVYGDPDISPQHEGYEGKVSLYSDRACYDEGKRAAETLSWIKARKWKVGPGSHSKPLVHVARLFNTYGPMMDSDDGRVVSNFIVQALAGKLLTVYGDGSQTRSLCYVSDTVAGIRTLMDSNEQHFTAFNIGNPDERQIIEIADEVYGAVTHAEMPKMRVQFMPLPEADPKQRCPDISRMRALGWEPKVYLSDGIEVTVKYFKRVL